MTDILPRDIAAGMRASEQNNSSVMGNTFTAVQLGTDTRTSIPALQARKQLVHKTFSKADAALSTCTITPAEYYAFLQHQFGTTKESDAIKQLDEQIAAIRLEENPRNTKTALLITIFCIVMLSSFAALYYGTGGVTGAVVIDTVGVTYGASTTITVPLDGVTGVTVAGTAQGEGDVTITLVQGGEQQLLYAYNHAPAQTAHGSLAKRIYIAGEPIILDAHDYASAYLVSETEAFLLDSMTLPVLPVGEYYIRLLFNNTNETEELPFSVQETLVAPQETFSTCGEACNIVGEGEGIITLAITDGASVTIDSLTYSTQANNAPTLVNEIPDVTAIDTVRIDIASMFTDADNDALVYDSSHHQGMTESITDGVFTISGPAGTYTYIVYASDTYALTPSNIFSVTITTPNAVENETINSTINSTPTTAYNETNTTLNTTADTNQTDIVTNTTTNITVNATQNTTINTTVNGTVEIDTSTAPNTTENNATEEVNSVITTTCDDADPNKRPIECLTENAQDYFVTDVYLEDVNRAKVARLTPLGNLFIRGRPITYSIDTPPTGAFSIGYETQDLVVIPTIWIDTEGNLHTRGRIYEENTQLVPPAGSYTIINRRGVYLAYADKRTGDLYLRGNLIAFKEDIG